MTTTNPSICRIVPNPSRCLADTMANMSEPVIRLGGDQPATPASTVLILRNGVEGLEVFMLQRHLDSDFVGGAFVFPGGKVDAADRAMPPPTVSGKDPDGFLVAAIRESFEECGVLLAHRAGKPIDAATLALPSFLHARQQLASRDRTWDWRPWLEDEDVTLDLDSPAWWSWWVTPLGVHRRFDTRFFVAVVPDGHDPVHDDIETTASRWMRPEDALAAGTSGEVTIILPTRKNLETLAGFDTAEAVIGAAHKMSEHPPRIQPEVTRGDDGNIWITHHSFAGPEHP